MEDENILNRRISAFDFLRGVAVLLMIHQHVGAWLVRYKPQSDPFFSYFFNINYTGVLAAPLFVTLAGAGAYFLSLKRIDPGALFIKRGVFLLCAGYALNILAPFNFSLTAWYVLHILGVSMIIAPLLVRLNTVYLLFAAGAVLLITIFLQTYFQMPINVDWSRMNQCRDAGEFFAVIFYKGHFPLFPWMHFFISGIITARVLTQKRAGAAVIYGILLIAAGGILALIYHTGYAFAVYGKFYRLFVYKEFFYPPLMPLILMLSGIAVLAMAAVYRLRNDIGENVISIAGRYSLTLFMLHIVILHNLFSFAGLRSTQAPAITQIAALFFTVIFTAFSYFLYRFFPKISLENLMRKITR